MGQVTEGVQNETIAAFSPLREGRDWVSVVRPFSVALAVRTSGLHVGLEDMETPITPYHLAHLVEGHKLFVGAIDSQFTHERETVTSNEYSVLDWAENSSLLLEQLLKHADNDYALERVIGGFRALGVNVEHQSGGNGITIDRQQVSQSFCDDMYYGTCSLDQPDSTSRIIRRIVKYFFFLDRNLAEAEFKMWESVGAISPYLESFFGRKDLFQGFLLGLHQEVALRYDHLKRPLVLESDTLRDSEVAILFQMANLIDIDPKAQPSDDPGATRPQGAVLNLPKEKIEPLKKPGENRETHGFELSQEFNRRLSLAATAYADFARHTFEMYELRNTRQPESQNTINAINAYIDLLPELGLSPKVFKDVFDFADLTTAEIMDIIRDIFSHSTLVTELGVENGMTAIEARAANALKTELAAEFRPLGDLVIINKIDQGSFSEHEIYDLLRLLNEKEKELGLRDGSVTGNLARPAEILSGLNLFEQLVFLQCHTPFREIIYAARKAQTRTHPVMPPLQVYAGDMVLWLGDGKDLPDFLTIQGKEDPFSASMRRGR